MAIDVNSSTWREIQKFISAERDDAISMLIADRDSERQRGILLAMDKLEALVPSEDNQT
jgi:hypothetical protein